MSSIRNIEDYNILGRGYLILIDLDLIAKWIIELKVLNEQKGGARYRYPESLIELLAFLHSYIMSYRQIENFVRALSQHIDFLRVPDYTTIRWRVSRGKYWFSGRQSEINKQNSGIIVVLNTTGLVYACQGQSICEWISKKYKVGAGFIMIKIAHDNCGKENFSFEVTKNFLDGKLRAYIFDFLPEKKP